MAALIDVLIRPAGADSQALQVFLSAPGCHQAFLAPVPDALLELQALWRQRFLRHHDPAFIWPEGGSVLATYSERLQLALSNWLTEPSWQALQDALNAQPTETPLALRLDGVADTIRSLPWEALPLQRPIWRVDGEPQTNSPRPRRLPRIRQPRILLLLGAEEGLNLNSEVERLNQLQRHGRIALTMLRGPTSSPAQLRRCLSDPAGWDALLFLGHSSDGPEGGVLHFGDGSQLDGRLLEHDWALAATHGLRLLLLNSCSGLSLAHHAARAGIDWAVCFLEPIPAAAAATAFQVLLTSLETGGDLHGAIASARLHLSQAPGCEGCALLLAAVAAATAQPFQLPLRRRRQLALRLAQTSPKQAAVTVAAILLAFGMELAPPANPLNTYLLNRRLEVQRIWRQLIAQPGPRPTAAVPRLPVLLLDASTTIPALGVRPTPDHTPREALVAVLRRTPVAQVPVVGLDVILDQPFPGTAALADVIRAQPQRTVVAGYLGSFSDPREGQIGIDWLNNSPLVAAGLKPADLAVGTGGGGGLPKPAPLQLQEAITAKNFAGALARHPDPYLPADRIIDWSINWANWIELVDVNQLGELKAPVLLVGSNGFLGPNPVDLFSAPAPVRGALLHGDQPLWRGSASQVPGVLVQAVLVQSLNLRHWLTPLSPTLCTLATASLGLLLAALHQNRRQRLLAIAVITIASWPLVFTLAVVQLWLIPTLWPCLALAATSFSRDD